MLYLPPLMEGFYPLTRLQPSDTLYLSMIIFPQLLFLHHHLFNHITGMSSMFTSYHGYVCSGKDKVHVPDGSFSSIAG